MDTPKKQDVPKKQDADAPDDREQTLNELGDTDEDRLETVAGRNESLEARLPDDDELPRTTG